MTKETDYSPNQTRMNQMRPPTLEHKDELRKMLESGTQIETCAVHYGCDSKVIRRRALRWKIELPKRVYPHLTIEQKAACARLGKEKTKEHAGSKYGVSSTSVATYIKKLDAGELSTEKKKPKKPLGYNPLAVGWV